MSKDTKSVTVNLRIEESLKQELQKLASVNRRSLSDYIRLELEKIVKSLKK